MKKLTLIITLVLASISSVLAQRMVSGQKGLELNAGLILNNQPANDYYLSFALANYFNRGSYWLWSGEYNTCGHPYKSSTIRTESFLAETGYSIRLFGDKRKTFNLNAALTGVAGYELINGGEKVLDDGAVINNKDGFVYGGGGRISLETYLPDRCVIILHGRLKALWGNTLQQFRPAIGAGFRFNF